MDDPAFLTLSVGGGAPASGRQPGAAPLQRMQALADATGPVTPADARAFSRAAGGGGWARDPEDAHHAEFRFRTRVLAAIARGSLAGEDARLVCAPLAALARDKRLSDKRWFA